MGGDALDHTRLDRLPPLRGRAHTNLIYHTDDRVEVRKSRRFLIESVRRSHHAVARPRSHGAVILRRILASATIDHLTDEVGVAMWRAYSSIMSRMMRRTLGDSPLRSCKDQMCGPPSANAFRDKRAGPIHRGDQRAMSSLGCRRRRSASPSLDWRPVDRVPWRTWLLREQQTREVRVLDAGQMLEQAAQGYRRRTYGRGQACRIESSHFHMKIRRCRSSAPTSAADSSPANAVP